MTSNAFTGTCDKCSETVEIGDGAIIGGKTGPADSWTVRHNKCTPVVYLEKYSHDAIMRRIRTLVDELKRHSHWDLVEVRVSAEARELVSLLDGELPAKQEYDL